MPDYSKLMDDFVGFHFNNINSKDYHIYHVSNGSRYIDNLVPTTQHKTVQVPGGDGSYYFGTYFTQRVFDVQIAYDSMTEQDLRDMRR